MCILHALRHVWAENDVLIRLYLINIQVWSDSPSCCYVNKYAHLIPAQIHHSAIYCKKLYYLFFIPYLYDSTLCFFVRVWCLPVWLSFSFLHQGITLLMMGSADALPAAPVEKTVFMEDMSDSQLASVVRVFMGILCCPYKYYPTTGMLQFQGRGVTF